MPNCHRCDTNYPDSGFRFRKDRCALRATCRVCENADLIVYKSTPKGRATRMWNNMNRRSGNKYGDHPTYADVEVRMSRDRFIAWATPRLENWYRRYPSVTPTIDRISSDGHYEIGNLRLLTAAQNTKARGCNKNIHAPEGMAWCFICKKYLDKSSFHKDKCRPNRLQRKCKSCHRIKYQNVQKPRPSRAEADAVIHRYKNGETGYKIAKDCGRSMVWVYRAIQKFNDQQRSEVDR